MDIFGFSFLLAWILIPFIWILILKIGGMSLLSLSLPSFLVNAIIVFNYIGFPILYFELDHARVDEVYNTGIIVNTWIITSITTTLICTGALIGKFIFGPLNFFQNKLIKSNINHKYLIRKTYVLAFFCILIIYIFITKIGFDNLAISVALNDSIFDSAIARSKMGNDFKGSYHWYNIFMRDVLMFTTLILLAMRWLKIVKVSLVLITIIIAHLIFSLVMATEKGHLINYFILLMLLFSLTKNNGKISLKYVFILLFPIFVSLIILYIFFMGDGNIYTAIFSIFSRGLTGSIQPAYHYLEFFPNYQGLLYGRSFPNPAGLLPFDSYNIGVEVINFMQPQHLETGIVGTMPAIYWGEIYANFGYYGLVILPPIIGFLLYIINWFIFKLEFNPLNVAFFSWILIHYKNLSITSFSNYLFDLYLFIIVLVYLILRFRFVLAPKCSINENNFTHNSY